MNFGLFKAKKWSFPAVLRFPGFGFENRGPAEFKTLSLQLQTAQSHLEEAAHGLEGQFLNTSSEIEKLADFGNQFVREVEKLIALATGKGCDNTVFFEAIHVVEETTAFLVSCETETREILERLRGYKAQIEKLLEVEAELRHAMLPLSIVQTLFKMESAPLGLGVQQMFGSLTQEIESLHGQMREVFGTKFQQLQETRQTIGLVIGKLERHVASLESVTTTRKAQIEASLNTLKTEMHNNQERDARLNRFSHDLAHEVEQVVMGLQFHDIVSQKLQHVVTALPEITTNIDEVKARTQPGRVGEALLFIRQSCRLEAGQLELAQQEMAGAEGSIRSGIQKVLAQLTEMDSRCLSLEEFTMLTTSFDGIVQVLVETIEEVRNVVTATVNSATEAYGLLQPLGHMASGLTLNIRNMSGQIHFIGLNAQVKAAQVVQDNRGQGLEVLSAKTSEISEATSRISGEAAAELDTLASGLAATVKAFEELQVRGQTQHLRLDEQGRSYETQLHAIRDGALEALRVIGASLENIKKQAREALATVDFSEFHGVTLPALRAPLSALGDAADAWLRNRRHFQADPSLVERFKRDYTMASERKVFEGIVAAGAASPGPVIPQENAAPPVAPEDNPPVIVPVEPLPSANGPPSATPALAAAPTPHNDLGDNVELF